jgi:hypothetical protein
MGTTQKHCCETFNKIKKKGRTVHSKICAGGASPLAAKRCQQDSNLQPPVPETDALPLRHDTHYQMERIDQYSITPSMTL